MMVNGKQTGNKSSCAGRMALAKRIGHLSRHSVAEDGVDVHCFTTREQSKQSTGNSC